MTLSLDETNHIVGFGQIQFTPILMHAEKVIVWRRRFIFFKDGVDQLITVNDEHYRSMIKNFFWPELDDLDTNGHPVFSTG